jgi:hypothetical protein
LVGVKAAAGEVATSAAATAAGSASRSFFTALR